MKLLIHISTLAILLTGCQQVDNPKNTEAKLSDTTSTYKINREIFTDSLLFVSDTSFADVQLKRSITKEEFENFKEKYVSECVFGTEQNEGNLGLYIINNCRECFCETYLGETKTNRRLLLPSTFDAGIMSVLPSPDCKRFVVLASYDLPEYYEFYDHRAEFYLFTLVADKGVDEIKPVAKHFSKKWSFQDITWIDRKTIAIKVYANSKPTDKDYKYFTVDFIF